MFLIPNVTLHSHPTPRQVREMQECFRQQSSLGPGELLPDFSNLDLRAEQTCAYDRYHFGRPGSGRRLFSIYLVYILYRSTDGDRWG